MKISGHMILIKLVISCLVLIEMGFLSNLTSLYSILDYISVLVYFPLVTRISSSFYFLLGRMKLSLTTLIIILSFSFSFSCFIAYLSNSVYEFTFSTNSFNFYDLSLHFFFISSNLTSILLNIFPTDLSSVSF